MRKSSVSQAQNSPGGYGLASPTSTRSIGRRREPSESYPFPRDSGSKPDTSRFSREESHATTPPPALLRRRTDYKEGGGTPGTEERDKDKKAEGDTAGLVGLGGLKRSVTMGSGAGLNGPSSPWSTTTPTSSFGPMGAFSSFGLGANQSGDKRSGFGSLRSESRFRGLMSKDTMEPAEKELDDKPSLSKLTEQSEAETGQRGPSWMEARANRPLSNETDPFPEDDLPTGSAALGGGLDTSPPRSRGLFGLGTPQKQESGDDAAFSAFGMTADPAALRDSIQGRSEYAHQTPPQRKAEASMEPMSPTDTNPYQSPDHDKLEHEDESDIPHLANRQGTFGLDQSSSGLPGLGGFGNIRGSGTGPFDVNASDRSQTSSTGPSRPLPGLSGFGGLPGLGSSATWSAHGGSGTPSQDKSRYGDAFGENSMFGSIGDLQSPSFGGLGSGAPFGGLGSSGTLGRGSKMGSLFPAAMQEQMRASETRGQNEEGSVEGQQNPFGTFGRNAFGTAPSGAPPRESESPFRGSRGLFDDLLGSSRSPYLSGDLGKAPFGQAQSTAPLQPPTGSTASQMAIGTQPGPNIPRQGASSSASNQPPALQQRTMVMPDRMRWVYKDPSGSQQGPWSGLEMHDWFKAGFFSAELQVKKEEDPDFEPLANLIRRIGNSREPFLVPQIGIPHGPASTQPGNAWATGAIGAPTPSVAAAAAVAAVGGGAGSAQPPFASSFPSFGTTLTAEQQNALERRKQEEQYLMARQKEHLAQQQMMVKMQQMQGGVGPNLHHHGSAHSLHSQPSFGSMTSPGGFQASPSQGPAPGQNMPGFFDNSLRASQTSMGPDLSMLSNIREEDMPGVMEGLNLNRQSQGSLGSSSQFAFQQQQQQPGSHPYSQQMTAAQNERMRLQREQQEYDALLQRSGNDQLAAQASAERLQEFQDLRAQLEQQDHEQMMHDQFREQQQHEEHDLSDYSSETSPIDRQPLEMTLTEQIQQRQQEQEKPQHPWANRIDTSAPVQPFPPPTSQSPMPAPVAQRKQNLADQLNAESRSQNESPSVETPGASLAPWAKETNDQQTRGPSLKEIQQAEAKKAAEREAIEAAARRAQAEKELLAAANAPAPAPGLPSGATWASGATSTPPSAAVASAWVKPLAGKTPTSSAQAKKTLQQIQREEEARKQRAAAATIATATMNQPTTTGPGGKAYADLARKAAPVPATPNAGGAWMTVGAGGKAKAPPVPAGPATPATVRSVSGPAAPIPKVPSVAKVGTPVKDKATAQEELRKWAVGELRGDMKGAGGKSSQTYKVLHKALS